MEDAQVVQLLNIKEELLQKYFNNDKEYKVNFGQCFNLLDYFENGEFNMIYSREMDYIEMVYRLKYAYRLSQKTQLMSKEQIVQLKKQRKFLKEQLKIIDKN